MTQVKVSGYLVNVPAVPFECELFDINTEVAAYPDKYYAYLNYLQDKLAAGLVSRITIEATGAETDKTTGKQWAHKIPFRACDESLWMEIYWKVSKGEEKLVGCKIIDADTIEIVTEEIN